MVSTRAIIFTWRSKAIYNTRVWLRLKSLQKPIVIFIILLIISEIAFAAIWYEAYAKAEDAIRAKQWLEAIKYINQAIEQKPDSAARARTYGLNFAAYFPYLKLAIAYYNLGQLDAAFRGLDTEEKLKAINSSEPDLAELKRVRDLVTQAQKARAADAQRQIREFVSKALDQASSLEAKGQLDAAISEVGRALALAPEDSAAKGALSRLQTKVVQFNKQREQEYRAGALKDEGQFFLAIGQYEAASGKFTEALSIAQSDSVQKLLEEAQEKLRSQLVAAPLSREEMITKILEDSRKLQAEGNFNEALAKLQSALAIDLSYKGLKDFQQTLLTAISKASEVQSRNQRVKPLLQMAEKYFAAENYVESLASANQALALEPENGEAKGFEVRAHLALNKLFLERIYKPPVIFWRNKPNFELQPGHIVEKVNKSGFNLSGFVILPAQAELFATLNHYVGDKRALKSPNNMPHQERGGLKPSLIVQDIPGIGYVTNFEISEKIMPGLSILSLISLDPRIGPILLESTYEVYYVAPFYSTTWFLCVVIGLMMTAAGGVYGLTLNHRNRVFKRRFNPYIAGAPVLQDDLFFGREQLLQNILQTIHNNSIMLFGERRIGKTSVQHHLKKRLEQLKDPDYTFYGVFIDLQGIPQERFFITLREEIVRELAPMFENAHTSPSALHGSEYDYRELVEDIRQVLKALAAGTNKKIKLVLLIDEVDQLNSYDPRVNQRLRSLFMRNFSENLAAVVSGVSIKKHWDGEGSPWYNFFEEIEVKPFRYEDAKDLIERPIRGIFRLEKGVTDRIIEITECRPYLIQKMCISLINRMHEERRRMVTLADVDSVGRPKET